MVKFKILLLLTILFVVIVKIDIARGWAEQLPPDMNPYREQDTRQLQIIIQKNQYSVAPELVKEAFKYVRQNFMRYYEKDDVYKLNIEDFKELLSSDDLTVSSEEIVFRAIQKWIEVNKYPLVNGLVMLIQVVRFPLLTMEFLTSVVASYVDPCNECRQKYLAALEWHNSPQKRNTNILNNLSKPRLQLLNTPLLISHLDANIAGTMQAFDYLNNRWLQFKFDTRKRKFGIALVDTKLYIIGGKTLPDLVQNTVDTYDLTTGIMLSSEPLPEPRMDIATAVVGKGMLADIYVIGGNTGKLRLKTVLKWDPILRRWFPVAPMPTARSSCSAAVHKNRIYVAGGVTKKSIGIDTLEVYDIQNNKWYRKSPMPSLKYAGGFAATAKYIYYVGGHSGQNVMKNSAERYDPKTNTWITIESIQSGGRTGLISFNNSVLVAGGTKYDVQIYDEQAAKWNSLKPLNIPYHGILIEVPWNVQIKY